MYLFALRIGVSKLVTILTHLLACLNALHLDILLQWCNVKISSAETQLSLETICGTVQSKCMGGEWTAWLTTSFSDIFAS